jgi:hypothetical protein
MRILTKAAFVLAATISGLGALAAGPAQAATRCPPCPQGQSCSCENSQSPIIIDVDGSSFHLTSLAQGVRFDFYGDGHPIQMAWIAPGSTNAFLVLPRNGAVTNGAELFGNLTPQPKSADPNGFLALATYAALAKTGNVIDSRDPIYAKLRLWQFSNQNGHLVAGKLSTLPQLGITAIDLNYQVTGITDKYGNAFRYRARIVSSNPHAGTYTYDVFLRTGGSATVQGTGTRAGAGNDAMSWLLALIPLGLLLGVTPTIRRRRGGDQAEEQVPAAGGAEHPALR